MKKVLRTIFLVLALGILTIPHELSHASAVLLAGGRVEFISLGVGPQVALYQLFGIPVKVGLLPLWGSVRVAEGDLSLLESIFVYIAGPVHDAIALALAYGALSRFKYSLGELGRWILGAFIYASSGMVLLNWYPFAFLPFGHTDMGSIMLVTLVKAFGWVTGSIVAAVVTNLFVIGQLCSFRAFRRLVNWYLTKVESLVHQG